MLPTPCPWTAAADASEEHAKRAWSTAHETRTLALCLDPRFAGTIQDTHALARLEEDQAEALGWATDFFRFAAQHPQAYNRLRELLEADKPADYAARAAFRDTRPTTPVGGAASNVIDLARARK
jgi:hypothetical protein